MVTQHLHFHCFVYPLNNYSQYVEYGYTIFYSNRVILVMFYMYWVTGLTHIIFSFVLKASLGPMRLAITQLMFVLPKFNAYAPYGYISLYKKYQCHVIRKQYK